jgi:predicted nucleotidyltransferase component of viral defense system
LLDAVIDKNMLEICRLLSRENFIESYYLAGGTALAIQIKHRKSNDLDFFTLGNIEAKKITDWLHNSFAVGQVNIIFRKTDQLDVNIMDIKTSFISYPFRVINRLINGENIDLRLSGLKIAPPEEIALMKAYTIGRRTSFRDYVDLYYLLYQNSTDIERIIKECDQKYVLEGETFFSRKLFLQQLKYTEDINDKRETEQLLFDKKVTVEKIESYLNAKVCEYLSEYYMEELRDETS